MKYIELTGTRYKNKYLTYHVRNRVDGFCGGFVVRQVKRFSSIPKNYDCWPTTDCELLAKVAPGMPALKALCKDIVELHGLCFGMVFMADKMRGDINAAFMHGKLKPFSFEVKRTTINVVPELSDWYVNYNHGDKHKVRHLILYFSKEKK